MRGSWRGGTPLVVLLSGALFAVSFVNSDGTDLRPGYTSLADLVRGERQETERINRRLADINADIERLSAQLGDRTVNRYQRRLERLGDPAGMTPVTGPAVRVVLTDAPDEVISEAEKAAPQPGDDPLCGPLCELVVHQQDIQAVANAMWRAGAEAVTIQGQRLISTTGIKCEGNSVTLHGVPYSPPYEIVAVGDQLELMEELATDPYVSLYREDAADPDGGVGYELDVLGSYTAPGYEGVVDLDYARPLTVQG